MKNSLTSILLIMAFFVTVFLVGCGGSSDSSGNSRMVSGGSWYATGFEWPHDGSPWES